MRYGSASANIRTVGVISVPSLPPIRSNCGISVLPNHPPIHSGGASWQKRYLTRKINYDKAADPHRSYPAAGGLPAVPVAHQKGPENVQGLSVPGAGVCGGVGDYLLVAAAIRPGKQYSGGSFTRHSPPTGKGATHFRQQRYTGVTQYPILCYLLQRRILYGQTH